MTYDILIKGGLIIDGSGALPAIGDVGINGDAIAAMGGLEGADGRVIIDANGLYVAPGFVDITNHADTHLTMFQYPCLESLLMQGITTIIGGNCGSSLAPLASPHAIESVKKWVDPRDINLNWATFGEFLAQVDTLHPGVNFGSMIGLGTIRRGIIGDQIRLLDDAERETARYLLSQAASEGAFGLSLGLAYGHERVSTAEEIIDIARAIAPHGILKIHLRSESGNLVASVNEAIYIGREAGVPVEIGHLKAIGKRSWPFLEKAIELIERARASGLNIHYDVSPYSTTGSPLYILTPAWARSGGFAELFRRIDAPDERQKIIGDLRALTLHYDKIFVIRAKVKNIVGRTMEEIASSAGLAPEEALLETLRSNEGRVVIVGKTVSRRAMQRVIRQPRAFMASDGEGFSEAAIQQGDLTHPRSFGAFPHFWHQFVTDTHMLSPEEAIWKITGGPAEKLGLDRRGRLEKGYFADITVFDPMRFRDRATYKNPFRYAAGIEWVLVNGTVAVAAGSLTGARAGKAIRKRES